MKIRRNLMHELTELVFIPKEQLIANTERGRKVSVVVTPDLQHPDIIEGCSVPLF